MRNNVLIIIVCVLLIPAALFTENNEKEVIFSSMTFPDYTVIIGNILNDPVFIINLLNLNDNSEKLKKFIIKAEREAGQHPGPGELFKLGNLYKEIYDYDNAVKDYMLSLKAFEQAETNRPEFYEELVIKGQIYFALAETDYRIHRSEYLEKSVEFLKTAIGLKPEKDLWIKLGDCYLASGKINEALYCYKRINQKSKINHLHARLQAATFQADYIKLTKENSWRKMNNVSLIYIFDFENIQTAINNSSGQEKDILRVQHYIYLMRLLLLKEKAFMQERNKEITGSADIFSKDEKAVINEAENYISTTGKKSLRAAHYNYLMGIINYIKSDYRNAVLFFGKSLNENEYPERIYNEIISTIYENINDDDMLKKMLKEKISMYPEARDYLLLGEIEFKNNNLSKAAMLCRQALKFSADYPEAYSALAVIFAKDGNYLAADEMIQKAFTVSEDNYSMNRSLNIRIKVNEAAIALLKKENERAYVLLRTVLNADNDEKAGRLYRHFFNMDRKFQN